MSLPRFAVYSTSRGDYFFAEIGRLLACGLRELGYEAVEADERAGFVAGAQWHVIAGPQEFFYLGAGRRLRAGPWPPGVILYNAEQPPSAWFPLVRRLLPRAHAVWDMDPGACRLWSREGRRSSHVPLGWVDGCEFFEPVRKLPLLPWTRALGPLPQRSAPSPSHWSRRPVDLLFAGSRVPRRKAFFAAAAPLLSRYRSLIRLVDDDHFLRPGAAAPRHTQALLGLAQRSKIVLNLHRHEAQYFEWHRIALHGIAQGALVVSEPTSAAPPLKAGRDFVEASLANIPATIEYFLASAQGRREAARIAAQGQRTYRRTCRLAAFLAPAVSKLGDAGRAPVRRARLRVEAAAEMLRSLSSPARRTRRRLKRPPSLRA